MRRGRHAACGHRDGPPRGCIGPCGSALLEGPARGPADRPRPRRAAGERARVQPRRRGDRDGRPQRRPAVRPGLRPGARPARRRLVRPCRVLGGWAMGRRDGQRARRAGLPLPSLRRSRGAAGAGRGDEGARAGRAAGRAARRRARATPAGAIARGCATGGRSGAGGDLAADPIDLPRRPSRSSTRRPASRRPVVEGEAARSPPVEGRTDRHSPRTSARTSST